MTRPNTTPPSILKGLAGYNHKDIILALADMFFGKCYLCETKEMECSAVEHFDAGEADRSLWENLYFACGRCNSWFKGNRYNNLLDPADNNCDVFKAIKLEFPVTPNSHVNVSIGAPLPHDERHTSTQELLDNIYNKDSTGHISFTRHILRQKLYKKMRILHSEIDILIDENKTDEEREISEKRIINLLKPSQEFSAFIRWAIMKDETLKHRFESHIID